MPNHELDSQPYVATMEDRWLPCLGFTRQDEDDLSTFIYEEWRRHLPERVIDWVESISQRVVANQ